MDVNGKVAVVTGAASGIGFALSKALMAAGAKGVAMAALQADALQAHAATIDGLAVPTDVPDEAASNWRALSATLPWNFGMGRLFPIANDGSWGCLVRSAPASTHAK